MLLGAVRMRGRGPPPFFSFLSSCSSSDPSFVQKRGVSILEKRCLSSSLLPLQSPSSLSSLSLSSRFYSSREKAHPSLVTKVAYNERWGRWLPPVHAEEEPEAEEVKYRVTDEGDTVLDETEVDFPEGHPLHGVDFEVIDQIDFNKHSSKSKQRKFFRGERRWFSDRRRIKAIAGRGGGGCKSFSRGKIRRSGPADGGDGGRGGDVIVIAKKGLQQNLRCLKLASYSARNGEPGGANKRKGRDGGNTYIEVPVGTIIKRVKDDKVELSGFEATLASLEAGWKEEFPDGSDVEGEGKNELEGGLEKEFAEGEEGEGEGLGGEFEGNFEDLKEDLLEGLSDWEEGEGDETEEEDEEDEEEDEEGDENRVSIENLREYMLMGDEEEEEVGEEEEESEEDEEPEEEEKVSKKREKKVLEESPFLLKLAKKGDFEAVETIEFRVKNNLRRVREQTKNNPELEKQYARKIQRREERRLHRENLQEQKRMKRVNRAIEIEKEEQEIEERKVYLQQQWSLPLPEGVSRKGDDEEEWTPFDEEKPLESPHAWRAKHQWGVIADLTRPGEALVIARGGEGGVGNAAYSTSIRRSPKVVTQGKEGERCSLELELKILAQVGLVGFPNAGKSSFLRAVSRAQPKVAGYQFTTLRPHIGMIEYDDFHQISVADLPGLVEGAHENVGLGFEFLRHIERTAVLAYVIDVSRKDALYTFEQLRYELREYNKDLLQRPSIILANKNDEENYEQNLPKFLEGVEELLEEESRERIQRGRAKKERKGLPIFPTSTVTGHGISNVVHALRNLIETGKM